MAYIGKTPTVGNFQVCDAISVVNGQAAYTLQVGSTNVTPETANHMLVSLNGVLQKPGSSFTIAGSTMTFASNLATGDVIDFVVILGDVLNIGTPSDDTVTAAKIGANAVTAAKLNNDIISGLTALTSAPDSTDEFLISDAGTLKRIDASLVGGKDFELLATTNVTSSTSTVTFNSGIDNSFTNYYFTFNDVHPSGDGAQLSVQVEIGGSFKTDTNYLYAGIGKNHENTTISVYNNGHTAFLISSNVGNANDKSLSGDFTLHNPSDTTFSQLMQANTTEVQSNSLANRLSMGGYYNSGSAVTGVRFSMSSGTIDNAIFKMYGLK